jgi:predicted anti-sigma-YlaC factor YlaD
VTCDQVRELLPEQLLGGLDGPEELEVRRHLRGCVSCRDERAALEDGVAAFSHATHDLAPPPELRSKVLGTLAQEWADPVIPVGEAKSSSSKRWGRLLVAAAVVAVLAIAGTGLWGSAQSHRANLALADAASYQHLLHTLGGKDFRVGTLQAVGEGDVYGRVVLYDGDPSQAWSSWASVLVHTSSSDGVTVALSAADGRTLVLPPLHVTSGGSASSWLSTDQDLTPYNRLTISGANGAVIATATIAPA